MDSNKRIALQNQDHEYLKAQIQQLEGEVQNLRNISEAAQVIVQEQSDKAEAWRMEYTKLVEFANNMVRDIPRMHKRANNVMNFDNTPREVFEFIKLCEMLLEEFRAHLKKAMETPI